MSEPVAEQAEVALLKRETLESLHSGSTGLMQLAVDWKDLESRFDSIQKSIHDRVSDLEGKEQQLEWKSKYLKQKCREMETKMGEVKLREKELEEEKKRLDDKCLEIDQTYELVSKCHEKAEEKAGCMEDNLRLIRLKKRRLVPEENRLSVKRKILKRKFELLKNWGEEAVGKEKRMHDFESELNRRQKNLNMLEKRLSKKIKALDSREKTLEKLESDLRRKETRFEREYKVFVSKEKCLNSMLAKWKGEEVDDADIRFYITMNGKDLLGFLNSHSDQLNMMSDEITRALKMSSNAPKLVLDAVQEFYGDSKLEEKYDVNVVKRSCIVLLEQLAELEPQIEMREIERAMLLAFEWKDKMKEDEDQNLEILGFLQLVCAFKLSNDFDKEELVKTVAIVAHHACAPTICSRLELEDKIPDIVQNLIENMHAVEAVRFIQEFKLMDKFSPPTILKNYLESVVLAADNFPAADSTKKQAKTMVVAALISVMKCIKDLKLDYEYPSESFEGQVLGLQRLLECLSSSEESPSPMEVSSGSNPTSASASASGNCKLSPVCDAVAASK